MKSYPMRCKHCGSLLDAAGGLFHRLLHGSRELLACGHCTKSSTRADAAMMGYSFGRWVDHFLDTLVIHTAKLQTLSQSEAAAELGSHNPDGLRKLASVDMLCSYLTHMFRPILLEQAHGREVELALFAFGGEEEWQPDPLSLGTTQSGKASGNVSGKSSGKVGGKSSGHQDRGDGAAALVGILGRVEDEHGVRESEAVIARVERRSLSSTHPPHPKVAWETRCGGKDGRGTRRRRFRLRVPVRPRPRRWASPPDGMPEGRSWGTRGR